MLFPVLWLYADNYIIQIQEERDKSPFNLYDVFDWEMDTVKAFLSRNIWLEKGEKISETFRLVSAYLWKTSHQILQSPSGGL